MQVEMIDKCREVGGTLSCRRKLISDVIRTQTIKVQGEIKHIELLFAGCSHSYRVDVSSLNFGNSF